MWLETKSPGLREYDLIDGINGKDLLTDLTYDKKPQCLYVDSELPTDLPEWTQTIHSKPKTIDH